MENLLIMAVWCTIWGVVVKKVIEDKGYQENWFWWGFFFGIFALIVALTKQSVNTTKVIVGSNKPQKIKPLTNTIFADKVDIYSAVHIVSWEIQRENDADFVLFVGFCNFAESIVSAVMFSAVGFNSFGEKVYVNGREAFDVIGQDISIEPGGHGKVQVPLPDANIRKLDIRVKKVCFSDGEIVENTTGRWVDTKQNSLPEKYLDCVKRENPQGEFYSLIEEEYWQCVCGFVNTGEICRSCNMKKLIASEYTIEGIEDTYQKYLEELDAEAKAKEKRAKKKKANIKKAIILGSVVLVSVVGIRISIFSYEMKEKRMEEKRMEEKRRAEYEEERIIISQYIENEEYDNAYSVMISSDSYDKLKVEYGAVLWEKQETFDYTLKKKSWTYARNEDEMVYNADLARDGICYYTIEEKTEHDTLKCIYAVMENGERSQIYSKAFSPNSYDVYIVGLGYKSDYTYSPKTMWSNGWLFITVYDIFKEDSAIEGESNYAVKYDKEEQKVYEVDLSDDTGWGYAKMKDGNILIVSEIIDHIGKAETIKLFDVVEGVVKEVSYDEVKKMYNNDVRGNILTRFK